MTRHRVRVPAAPRLRYVLLIFASIAVLSTASTMALSHGTQSSSRVLLHNLLVWGLFGLLAPIAIEVTRRFHLDRPRIGVALMAHVGALVVISVTHTAIYNAVMLGVADGRPADWWRAVSRSMLLNLRGDVFIYAMMAGGYLLWESSVRSRERERALVQARLDALTSRLQPHFLFNTLNSISTLVMKGDRVEAARMISLLSDLLRASMSTSERHTVPLSDELALVRRYLDIESVRFPDRLTSRIDVGQDLMAIPVPVLMVQTLVENAIRHGIATSPRGGSVTVRGERVGGRLRLEVVDDGAGPNGTGSEGVGLTTTRERLYQLYRDKASLELEASHSGTTARVEIPL